MAHSKFTAEEIELLQAHPYIIEVTPSKVCLSGEFKEIIWNRMQQGQDIHHILEEFNISCEMLGETRIAGMKQMIRKEGKSGNGFCDVHTMDYQSNGFKSQEKEIELLKQQLKYKEQEIEFLKKIVSLGQEE